MKKIIIATFIFTAALFTFTACDDTSDTENVSRITNYPIVNLNGESIVVLTQGDTYEELSAVATAGTEELPLTTVGTVDANTPGVYKVSYTATNSDGFPASKTRTVIVLSSAPSAYNLQGTFLRNGNPNTVVQISDRVYTANNAGGLPAGQSGDWLFVTFYNIDDSTLYIPYQDTPSGISVESTDGDLINNNRFTWVLKASAVYGSALRDFTR